MSGIGRYGGECLGRGGEQQPIDLGLVLIGDGAERRRQREDHMVIGDRQQLGFPCGQPTFCRRPLTLGAVPVTTGIVGHACMTTIITALDVAAESRGAANLDCRHHPALCEAKVAGVRSAPRLAVAAEDVRHLQLRS